MTDTQLVPSLLAAEPYRFLEMAREEQA